MGQDWPDDGPVPPAEQSFGAGFFYGVLATLFCLALAVWALVVWGGWQR